ncbi:thiol-disulfide oxidoreductase DCC family protein [Lutibacter sp.]|uniref:thiol-disulfide oxidoreductase DCC family protein n=1 Tax=Lutibacter sp. TaxID=1925666 RepID=UPI0027359BA9|nr:DCC1-like thiol-disulfide oxidoreductase family protein [Lutibacter sp.]MDP3312339.1 DCC1-like thiol-disulfide oxidoreductase family protein [Lutibacter sp.]
MNKFDNKSLILFDGICNLCNSSVKFIIKNDPNENFKFASIQSDAATEILLQYSTIKYDLDSIILIEEGKIYDKSTAILKIARKLAHGFSVCYIFIIVPLFIRDWVYSTIAKNRYNWFGKRESCMLPSLEIKKRFLN